MRKVLLLLCLLPFASFAQQSFTLNGKLKPSATPAKAFLYYTLNDKSFKDSIDVKGGVFTFKGRIPEPVKGFIKIKRNTTIPGKRPETDLLEFMVEPGTLSIISKTEFVKSAQVSGADYADNIARLYALRDSINAKAKAFVAPLMAATEEQKNDEAFVEPFRIQMEVFKAEMDNIAPDFIRKNPDSYTSLILYKDLIFKVADPAGSEAIFASLSPRLKATAVGKELQMKITDAKVLGVGQVAPDFTLNDVNGRPVKLSDFKGKYVLLDFWASWCQPCRKENPWIGHMYERYKEKNFTVLSVSLDKDKEAWLKAIKEDKLIWSNVSSLKGFENEVANMYFIQAIPASFLIAPDGKILGRGLRGILLSKKLEEVLGSIVPGK